MKEVRRARDIYHEEGGWFDARWHFSFGSYRDLQQMGIGPLRVFNDDRLIAGADWPMHPHKDVEGCTYVLDGLFEHADSLGNGGTLKPGGVQRMTLGGGAFHSERNGSKTKPMRFVQFWILPEIPSLPPENLQRQFDLKDRKNRLLRVFRPASEEVVVDEAIPVHNDMDGFISALSKNHEVEHGFLGGRGGYLYLISGKVQVSDIELETGDALKILGPELLRIKALENSELILIDVLLEFEKVGVWADR